MLYGKLRIHTCRVILLTSLVWFLVDVVVLSFYSECLGGACKKAEDSKPNAQQLVADIANNDYDQVEENNRIDSPNRYVILIGSVIPTHVPTRNIFQIFLI